MQHIEFERLIDYTLGNLSIEEIRVLDKHVAACEQCTDSVNGIQSFVEQEIYKEEKAEFYSPEEVAKLVKKAFSESSDSTFEQFSKELKEDHSLNEDGKTHPINRDDIKKVSRWRLVSVAASIVLLIGVGSQLFFGSNSIELIGSDKPYIDMSSSIKGERSDFNSAVIKYNEKQFEIAINLLMERDTIAVDYYLGLIELQKKKKDLKQAEKYFHNVFEEGRQSNHPLATSAAYYLAQITFKSKGYKACQLYTNYLKDKDLAPSSRVEIEKIERRLN